MSDKWAARMMEVARTVAKWSKDPSTKCGAVITDDRRIVSTGYNGFAANVDDSPENYADRAFKLDNVIHCEENALLQAREPVNGFQLFVTGMMCSSCTARVIQSGISMVVIPHPSEDPFFYRDDWKESFNRAKQQLEDSEVSLVVMPPSKFDPVELMGPEHPYIKKHPEELNMMTGLSNYEKVKEFHDHFNCLVDTEENEEYHKLLRTRLMMEELAELVEAMQKSSSLSHVAKELADVLYVVYGTADLYQIPMDEVFAEVHRSNMSKSQGATDNGKIVKGDDYSPPNVESVLKAYISR